MNTSPTENPKKTGGVLADALTLTRALLTPLIMLIIILAWPDTQIALFASILFAIAAITDLLDDMIGGPETAAYRQFGWFDDIADTVLIVGSLIALSFVIYKNGLMGPIFAIPMAIIILREILVGLTKGYELSKQGWPETKLGTLKNAISMLAICLLIASPWLTTWYDGFRATDDNIVAIFDNPSTHIWMLGQICLWIASLLSAFTGFQILTGRVGAANDA